MSPVTVLLSSPPTGAGNELRRGITAAGFAVADHRLGSAPAVDFGPIAVAVIDVGDFPDVAAAQARRWRAELGDRFLPVLWVAAPERAALGLDAGADVALAPAVAPEALAAQLRALARAQALAAKVAVRAGESRLLGDQLRKAIAQAEREQEMAGRVRALFRPRTLPAVGAARFHVHHRPRSRSGGDFYDVRRLDEQHVGFVVGDVIGTAAGALLSVFVQQSVVTKDIGERSYRVLPPDEVLTAVNRALLALGADDLPLVAMSAGVLNCQTGAVALARAGSPAAVYAPATGAPEVWPVPGPFLGAADTTYQVLRGTLNPGDRLLIGTDGQRPDGAPGPDDPAELLEAAQRHSDLRGPEFAAAVARELLSHVRHADDFTLLCVEMLPNERGAVVASVTSS